MPIDLEKQRLEPSFESRAIGIGMTNLVALSIGGAALPSDYREEVEDGGRERV